MPESVFIVDALRTPIGSAFRSLSDFSAAQLAGVTIEAIRKRNPVDHVNEVILGNAVSAGTGQNLARQAALLGGLRVTTPAFSVNHVCGAGLQAVFLGCYSILAHKHHLVLAGGTESASRAPKAPDPS